MDPKLNKAAEEGDVMYLATRIVRIKRTEQEELALGILRMNGTAEEENRCGRDEYRCLLNTTQEGRNNILHLAAKAGHDLFVALALQFLPALSNQLNSQGETPLLVAAKFDRLNVAGTIKKPKIKFQIRRDMAAGTTTLTGTYSSGSSRHVEEGLTDIPLELGTIHDDQAIGYVSEVEAIMRTRKRVSYAELYKAAKKGDVSCLSQIEGINITEDVAVGIQGGNFLMRTQHGNNNILHIAARAGHDTFVAEALKRFPFLSEQVNREGDTPFLVAARFGHLEVVKAFAEPARRRMSQGDIEQGQREHATSLENGTNSRDMPTAVEDATPSSSRPIDEGEGRVEHPSDVLISPPWKNLKQDTTVLHEALRSGHESVARYLFGLDPEIATLVNGAEESPLYLAAESGCQIFMMDVLHSEQPYSTEGPQGQNALHAAGDCDGTVINELIEQKPNLMRKLDDHGKAPIHYAVEYIYFGGKVSQIGFLFLLLDADASIAIFPDAEGYTPLLRAAERGLHRICDYILKICPESIEARNCKGQHVLHLANFSSFLGGPHFEKIAEIWELLNVSDDEGNTPLHLAVKENDLKKVKLITSRSDINFGAINKEGHTALDLFKLDRKRYSRKRLMWRLLMRHGVPHGRRLNEHKVYDNYGFHWIDPDADLKPFNSTMILVATLIATVTFAAAFTIPGAFDQNSGDAILAKKAALQVFIVSDTLAMCCSLSLVFLLSKAMFGEEKMAMGWRVGSWNLLYITFLATLVAFMSGIFAVISSKALWVAILVYIVCSTVPFTIVSGYLNLVTVWPTLCTMFFTIFMDVFKETHNIIKKQRKIRERETARLIMQRKLDRGNW